MKLLKDVLVVGVLAVALAAPVCQAGETCSTGAVTSALKKLDRNEKLARQGLAVWESGLAELRGNATRIRILGTGAKASIGVGLIAFGGGVFVGETVAAEFADFVVIGAAIGGGSALLAAGYPWVKNLINPETVEATLNDFERKRAEAGSNKVPPSWKDLFRVTSDSAGEALYNEALTKVTLYKQELKFIKDVRPHIQGLLNPEACANLNRAIASQSAAKKSWDQVTAPASGALTAAGSARH